MRSPWRFYVYELADADGCAYIGKGSGSRLKVQTRAHGLRGRELVRFRREADAYAHERKLIAEMRPRLNTSPGGNGRKATPKRAARKTNEEREMERLGTRVYAARALLRFDLRGYLGPSEIDSLRRAAHHG